MCFAHDYSPHVVRLCHTYLVGSIGGAMVISEGVFRQLQTEFEVGLGIARELTRCGRGDALFYISGYADVLQMRHHCFPTPAKTSRPETDPNVRSQDSHEHCVDPTPS